MIIKVSARTNAGMVRETNQDNFLVGDIQANSWFLNENEEGITLSDKGYLCVAADGMGGENAGDVAAGIAVEQVKSFFSKETIVSPVNRPIARTILLTCIHSAHLKIVDYVATHPECKGMGTTLTIAWFVNGSVHVAWSGDSPCFQLQHNGTLHQITSDHTIVNRLVQSGDITQSTADVHPERNILSQCLGTPDDPPCPDFISLPVTAGEKYLLCSDGLSRMVPASVIEDIVKRDDHHETICKNLVDQANDAGGEDNITVVFVDIVHSGTVESGNHFPLKILLIGMLSIIIAVSFIYYTKSNVKNDDPSIPVNNNFDVPKSDDKTSLTAIMEPKTPTDTQHPSGSAKKPTTIRKKNRTGQSRKAKKRTIPLLKPLNDSSIQRQEPFANSKSSSAPEASDTTMSLPSDTVSASIGNNDTQNDSVTNTVDSLTKPPRLNVIPPAESIDRQQGKEKHHHQTFPDDSI